MHLRGLTFFLWGKRFVGIYFLIFCIPTIFLVFSHMFPMMFSMCPPQVCSPSTTNLSHMVCPKNSLFHLYRQPKGEAPWQTLNRCNKLNVKLGSTEMQDSAQNDNFFWNFWYYFTLRSVSSLNNLQSNEMKYCENTKLTC